MVTLDTVRACNTDLANSQSLVAVFVGGTSGIGSYTIKALAMQQAKSSRPLRLYIVGRNQNSADRIISECQMIYPTGQFRFVRAENLALLKDVDRVCEEVTAAERTETGITGSKPTIDILVMTQAYLAFHGRRETSEGLDELLSLLFYSRMRFIAKLMPLLVESSLPARVISVFGPQRDTNLCQEDISLRDPKNYGFGPMGSHAAYMKTFYMEYLAAKYPGKLALIHYFPSLVVTDAFTGDTVPTWFKYAWKLVVPFSALFTVPKAESGERVLFLTSGRFPPREFRTKSKNMDGLQVAKSSDGVVGGGAYRVNWNGEIVPVKNNYEKLRADGWAERFRVHTEDVFAAVDAGVVFTG